MHKISIIITLALIFLILSNSRAQDWQARKQKDGITVYTKPVNDSSIDAFKAVMLINGDPSFVRYVLNNSDKYAHIFPDTEELKILERKGDDQLVQYSRTAAPWPVDDRDGIYEMVFIDREDGGFIVNSRALPDRLPEKDGVVRIRTSNSHWRVIPTGSNKLRIEYEVAAEPGGNIPDWLANTAITELPFNTMNNLRKVIQDQAR